jgi:O-antigen ligase
VHLAAAITYGILNPGTIPRLSLLVAPVTVVLVSLSRAALVIQALTAALLFALQPTARRPLLAAAAAMTLLIGLLAVADVEIEIPGRERSYSVQQLALGIASVVSRVDQGDLESTKTWRTDWWNHIADYTFGGAYFWMGKGYGINLADDDGFQVIEAGSGEPLLRHPHSVHLSFLARSGVPGLLLWMGVLVSLGHLFVTTWRHAGPRRRHLLLFHGVFLGAALLNASFDVYLEGPTGGIWFWFHAGCMAAVAMTPALDEIEPT